MGSLMHHELMNPATWVGACFYAIVFLVAASITARFLRLAFQKILDEDPHGRLDRTIFLFLGQLLQIAIYVFFLILYAHLIPFLHSIATALLTGASVISIVLGLAAQSTLGNLVAGVAVLLYRPFEVGDTIEVSAPSGHEQGIVQRISLGYTVLLTPDNRRVMVPNSAVMNQTTINLTPRPSR